MENVNTIEDLLELLSGLKRGIDIQIEPNNKIIIDSIARQVFKGTALTDRQLFLIKEKLLDYRDKFIELDCDFDSAIDTLRQPLRQIDRSKYIKVVDTAEVYGSISYESYKQKWKWLKVRFPFNKKTIFDLSEIITNASGSYFHKKGTHEHYFRFNETNTYCLINKFKNKQFDIDEEILDCYYTIEKIILDKPNVVPGIYEGKICNLHSRVNLDKKNDLLKIIDRKLRYGLEDISSVSKPDNSLATQIAFRETQFFEADPSIYSAESLMSSLYILDRFPLLVILNSDNAEEQLHEIYSNIKYLVPASEQSVLFRHETTTDFNNYVKENSLNNWVDNNTKIVYIKTNKLPKLFFTSKWNPITALTYGDRLDRNVDNFVKNRCDLIINKSKGNSLFQRYSRYYDYM